MAIEIVSQGEYILVALKGECTGDEKPGLHENLKKVLTDTKLKYVIVQCTDCSNLGVNLQRALTLVNKDLKAINGGIRLVNANEKIQESLKKNGLDRILVNKMSLRGALVDFGMVKAKEFDVNFINPFLGATTQVLKIQCYMEARPQAPYLKKVNDPMLLGDLSGIIAVNADTFTGTLAISFSEKVFLKIASNMRGTVVTEINSDVVELVGELANMILGQAKIQLSTLGHKLQVALPSCVWGKDHKIKHFGGGACVVIPFQTSEGLFYTEIMTHQLASAKT